MNNINLRKHTAIVSVLFIGIIFYHFFLYGLEDHDTIWNTLYGSISAIIYLYGAVIGFQGARAIGVKSTIGKSLMFLSLGAVLFVIGVSIWSYIATFTDNTIPYPSVGDIFFVLYYPLVALGVIMLLKMYKIRFNIKVFLQLLVMIAISYFITSYFLGAPVFDQEVGTYENIITTLYTLGDLIMISLALITLVLAGGRIIKALVLLVLSFLFQAGGDFYFSFLEAQDLFWDGHLADFFFTLSGFLLTLGIIQIIKRFRVPGNTPKRI